MRTLALQWSLHGVYATARAQRYCVSPSQINTGDRPKRMSCPPRRFVEDSSVSSAKKRFVNLVSIRRIVLLAEFPTIFALKIIFNCRNRHGTSEEKKESKMNLRSHFAPPKSARIPTNYISKRCKLIQLWIWRCIYYSEHALSSQSSFPRPAAFKTGHAFVNLHPNRRKKYKNAPSKFWQNNLNFSPLVA